MNVNVFAMYGVLCILFVLCVWFCNTFNRIELIELIVWEIMARSEPHVDVDPVDVGALIR
jgi:hypothetical protein